MNILVTGANGQLGNEMRVLAKANTQGRGASCSPQQGHNYVFSDIVASAEGDTEILDITDVQAVMSLVDKHDIDCIVNCAAYTNVEKAESDVDLCRRLNATAPGILAQAMQKRGGLLVHISTDYVFGGDPYNTPCKEDQKGTPTGVYGLTKLEGEKAIEASGCQAVIIRTAWLYSEYGKNFVKTMLGLTADKPSLKVVFDQVGTPTYALDLASAIEAIIADYAQGQPAPYPKAGIYHFSNEGVCSWYDFTKMIAEIAGHSNCDIQPCHSDEFPSAVKRPAFSVLDKTKIKQTFGLSIPYWTDSLRIAIQKLNAKN